MWVYKRDRDFMFVIQGFWWLLLAVWTVLSPILMIRILVFLKELNGVTFLLWYLISIGR